MAENILSAMGIEILGNTRFSFSDSNYVSILSTYTGNDAKLKLEEANKILTDHKGFSLKSYAPIIVTGNVSLLIAGTYQDKLEADKLVVDIAAVFS